MVTLPVRTRWVDYKSKDVDPYVTHHLLLLVLLPR